MNEHQTIQSDKELTSQPKVSFWTRLKESLKDWAWYRKEHPDWFDLDIQRAFRKLGRWMKAFYLHARRSWRRVVAEKRELSFPESDHPVLQLLLFAWGSLPRVGGSFKEMALTHRRRSIAVSGRRRSWFEEMKIHPVGFLATAMCIAAVGLLLSFYTIGTATRYNGISLGVVRGASISAQVADLEQVTQETLSQPDYQINTSLLETQTGLVLRKNVEARESLEEKLSERIGLVDYGYVLYVNGERIAATEYSGALEELLEQLKKGYVTSNTVRCDFQENVEIRQEYVDASYMMNLGYIAELLNGTKQGEVTYTVKPGDVWSLIAEQYGKTVDELLATNPGYDVSKIAVGEVLTISNAIPYLTVKNVERQQYVQQVPYEVQYVDNDSMYQGDTSVISAGTYGTADVMANVTYVNGEEVEREIVSTATLTSPVTEVQARGTKERPTWLPTGNFRWPCHGMITSYFGERSTGISGASTYHEGIDIASSYGTPVYASDGGTVVRAGWAGGLGYLVVVDHGNGYMTYYGHNSSIVVGVGDHVYQGQQVARMGSTGISSGNHCHFGVLKNNTFVNPLNYLS